MTELQDEMDARAAKFMGRDPVGFRPTRDDADCQAFMAWTIGNMRGSAPLKLDFPACDPHKTTADCLLRLMHDDDQARAAEEE